MHCAWKGTEATIKISPKIKSNPTHQYFKKTGSKCLIHAWSKSELPSSSLTYFPSFVWQWDELADNEALENNRVMLLGSSREEGGAETVPTALLRPEYSLVSASSLFRVFTCGEAEQVYKSLFFD